MHYVDRNHDDWFLSHKTMRIFANNWSLMNWFGELIGPGKKKKPHFIYDPLIITKSILKKSKPLIVWQNWAPPLNDFLNDWARKISAASQRQIATWKDLVGLWMWKFYSLQAYKESKRSQCQEAESFIRPRFNFLEWTFCLEKTRHTTPPKYTRPTLKYSAGNIM